MRRWPSPRKTKRSMQACSAQMTTLEWMPRSLTCWPATRTWPTRTRCAASKAPEFCCALTALNHFAGSLGVWWHLRESRHLVSSDCPDSDHCDPLLQDADDWWDGQEQADRGPAGGEDDAADASDSETPEPSDRGEEEPADDERYRDMLATATGRPRGADAGPAGRRRRRDVLVSEAYPESEYNLSAQAATAGAPQSWTSADATQPRQSNAYCVMLLICNIRGCCLVLHTASAIARH